MSAEHFCRAIFAGAPLLDYVIIFLTQMNVAGAIIERKTRININGALQQEACISIQTSYTRRSRTKAAFALC
jgi:hypothetical protein